MVAMANYQRPRVPPFAGELDPAIVQVHSFEYRSPAQLRAGDVLVVGAGNSGAEIAVEVVKERRTWLAGRESGHVPFRIDGPAARLVLSRLVLRVVFHRVLSLATPIGRRARPKLLHQAAPLIRTKPRDLAAAGVVRVPRVLGVRGGRPLLQDGSRARRGERDLVHRASTRASRGSTCPSSAPTASRSTRRGSCPREPGLYFVGLHFLYALSSEMIHGVGRDAARIAEVVAARGSFTSRAARAEPSLEHRATA